MKKLHFQILPVLLATLVGCSVETDGPFPEAPEGYHVETVKAAHPHSTRTSFDETTGKFSWSEGDRLAFHLSDGSYCTGTINPGTGKVRLLIPDGAVRDNYAVYPADITVPDHALLSDMQLNLPGSYDIRGKLLTDEVPMPMVADNRPGLEIISFNHVGALLQVNLTLPAGSTEAKVSLGSRLSGIFSPGTAPDGLPSITTDATCDDGITFRVSEEGLETAEDAKLLVPVPTGDYSLFRLTISDGREVTYRFEKAVSFSFARSAGKKVTIKDSSLEDCRDYFWFEALQAGSTVQPVMTFGSRVTDKSTHPLAYSYDKKEWTPYDYETDGALTLAAAGDRVWFRGGKNFVQNYMNGMEYDYLTFKGSGRLKTGGNLLTILNYLHPEMTNDPKENCGPFRGLFMNNTALEDASELILPDHTVPMCYWSLFQGCSSLTLPPVLPSRTVTRSCYNSMFNGCRSLTTAPVLPAIALAEACYMKMFSYCAALTAAPELPATDLAVSCYWNMFSYCTGLTRAPALPATILQESCYQEMFNNCYALAEAPALPALTLAKKCYYQMFGNCRALVTAPRLPATEMASGCYWSMFFGCKALTQAPELPALDLAESCYYQMFNNCIKLTAGPDLPATRLAKKCYYRMFWGCSQLRSLAVYFPAWPGTATTDPDYQATEEWLKGTASTGTFYKVPALETLTGNNFIPSGWLPGTIEDLQTSI